MNWSSFKRWIFPWAGFYLTSTSWVRLVTSLLDDVSKVSFDSVNRFFLHARQLYCVARSYPPLFAVIYCISIRSVKWRIDRHYERRPHSHVVKISCQKQGSHLTGNCEDVTTRVSWPDCNTAYSFIQIIKTQGERKIFWIA